jgi:DNA-binding CsgD family transcriptional regulator
MAILGFRPMRAADVTAGTALLSAEGARGALVDAALLRRLLGEHRLVARVVEEADAADGATLRACGLSARIDPATAARATQAEHGDFVEWLLRSCHGPAPPLLDRAATGALRRDGRLHMVVLGFAIDASDPAEVPAVTAMLHSAFMAAHSGYGLESLIGVVRPWERKAAGYRSSLLAMGCRAGPVSRVDGSQACVLDAAQIARQPFHVLQGLYTRRPPRWMLSGAQQDMLELAVHGSDDAAIAAALGITLHTVHKRWRAIHARAGDALPGLLPAPPAPPAARGPDKRKRLVEYARQHPEELRPWPAARRR